jgi:general secretion pathway protein G
MKPAIPLTSPRKLRRTSGFSLIEILIVIALIAVLATLSIGKLDTIFGGQQEKTAGLFVKSSVKAPLIAYRLDIGSYPTTEEGLAALMKPPAGKEAKWRGPYVEQSPVDPWNKPYQYRYPGSKNVSGARSYDVWSWGPDGTESGDDIGNW